MTDPASKKKKAILIGVATLGVFAIASAALVFKDRLTGATPGVTEIPATTASDLFDTPGPGASGRTAIILQDAVKGFERVFDKNSPVAATYQSGDQVQVVAVETKPKAAGQPDSEWYRVEANGKTAWVDGEAVFLFDQSAMFDVFISSTQPMKELFGAGEEKPAAETEKLAVLDSEEFYLRAARNPDRAIAENAQIKLLWRVAEEQVVGTWFLLAKDERIKDLTRLNMELSMVLTAGRSPTAFRRFETEFPTLPDATRSRVLRETCSAILSDKELFRVAVVAAGKDPKPQVFDDLVNCVASGFTDTGSSYDWSAPGAAVLRSKGVLEGLLPKEKLAIFTGKVPLDKIRNPSSQESPEPEPDPASPSD